MELRNDQADPTQNSDELLQFDQSNTVVASNEDAKNENGLRAGQRRSCRNKTGKLKLDYKFELLTMCLEF